LNGDNLVFQGVTEDLRAKMDNFNTFGDSGLLFLIADFHCAEFPGGDWSALGGSGLVSNSISITPASLLTGLYQKLADDKSIHPSTMILSAPEARALFGQGQAGFMVQGSWCIESWHKNNPDLQLGVAPPPLPDGGRKGGCVRNSDRLGGSRGQIQTSQRSGRLTNIFTIQNLIWINIGMMSGIIMGALPGLTATMGVALLLPLTYGIGTVPGILMLLGGLLRRHLWRFNHSDIN
jgi:hypothetical protein